MHSQTVGAHPRNPPTRGPSHVLTHLPGDVVEVRVGGGWALWAAAVLVLAVVDGGGGGGAGVASGGARHGWL